MSLRQQAAHGVRWTSMSMVVTTVVGIVQVAVLARLLTRQDFGLVSEMATVIGFAMVFADMGFSAAIIWRQDATRDELSTLYWMNLVTGVVLFAVMIALAPLIARFFHQPRIEHLMLWTSLIFLVTPIGQQFQILLQKQLLFRRLSGIEMAASIVGLCVGVTAALAHYGVYALIWAQLANATTKALLLAGYGWRHWRPHLHLRLRDLKGYFSFGLYQMGENGVYYWASNIDYLLIGRFLGATPLGVYTIAYQLVVLPLTKLVPVLTRVSFPVFAKRQHDDGALRRGYCEVVELMSFAVWPLLVGLAASAPVAMVAIYGSKWLASAVVVQLLVPMGMVKAIGSPIGSLLNSKGRADIGFWYNLLSTVVTVTVLYVAVHWGVRAVAASHSIIQICSLPVELWLLWAVIRLRPGDYLRRLAGPFATCLAMGAVVYATYLAIHPDLRPLTCLLILVAEGAAVYGGLWAAFRRDYVTGLWRQLAARA
ncbi:MAG TPA: MOP flippase family protein [Thermoleophilia bacterium]|nr:MOP flippase family protein [Thermoleophilia bacterium]